MFSFFTGMHCVFIFNSTLVFPQPSLNGFIYVSINYPMPMELYLSVY